MKVILEFESWQEFADFRAESTNIVEPTMPKKLADVKPTMSKETKEHLQKELMKEVSGSIDKGELLNEAKPLIEKCLKSKGHDWLSSEVFAQKKLSEMDITELAEAIVKLEGGANGFETIN